MIAVVTGASGFIGSNLVAALRLRGIEVRIVARPGSSSVYSDGVVVHQVDLRDATTTARSPVWDGATHVFHLAGLTRAMTQAEYHLANVVPAASLVHMASARREPPRIVHVSSLAAAGPAATRPLQDDDPPHPVELYGRSKLAAEDVLRAAMGRVPIVIVRPTAVYGPHDRDFLAVFRQLVQPVALHATPPHHRLSLVHVQDCVDALLVAATHDAAPGCTGFVSAHDLTWGALYDAVGRTVGRNPPQITVPTSILRLGAFAGDSWATITRAARPPMLCSGRLALSAPEAWTCQPSCFVSLGWSPRVTLEEGLGATRDWYVAQGWLKLPAS